MNVQPTLVQHPKFLMFKRALGDPAAMEYLVRLWGHCQVMQKGENWGKETADYVEIVCGWMGERGRLFSALVTKDGGKSGWITLSKKNEVIITGWNEHNKSLIKCWENGSKSGGRPRKDAGKPTDNPRVNRSLTGGKPAANPQRTLSELIGEDRSGEGSETSLALEYLPAHLPEADLPTVDDVVAHGLGPAGIPEEFCRHYFTQKNIKKSWVTARGVLVDWKLEVGSWWAKDRHQWRPAGSATTGSLQEKNREQLEAELDAERDPQKKRALEKKLAGLA